MENIVEPLTEREQMIEIETILLSAVRARLAANTAWKDAKPSKDRAWGKEATEATGVALAEEALAEEALARNAMWVTFQEDMNVRGIKWMTFQEKLKYIKVWFEESRGGKGVESRKEGAHCGAEGGCDDKCEGEGAHCGTKGRGGASGGGGAGNGVICSGDNEA